MRNGNGVSGIVRDSLSSFKRPERHHPSSASRCPSPACSTCDLVIRCIEVWVGRRHRSESTDNLHVRGVPQRLKPWSCLHRLPQVRSARSMGREPGQVKSPVAATSPENARCGGSGDAAASGACARRQFVRAARPFPAESATDTRPSPTRFPAQPSELVPAWCLVPLSERGYPLGPAQQCPFELPYTCEGRRVPLAGPGHWGRLMKPAARGSTELVEVQCLRPISSPQRGRR